MARSYPSSTDRRYRRADNSKILALGIFTMRPCNRCTSNGFFYVISPLSERCEQCHRFNRPCDLASPWAEFDRLQKQSDEL
jgi:hypothetical protein